MTLSGVEFGIHLESQPGTVRLRLQGELDLATVPRLEEALKTSRRHNPVNLEVDIDALSFIGATGLRVLVAAHHQASVTGRTFTVTNPDRMARRLMQLTRTTYLYQGPVSTAPATDTRDARR